MCKYPRNITQIDRYGKKVTRQVACGHCAECLRNYQNGIKLRAYYQYLQYPRAVFFTLTYAPQHLPVVADKLTGEVAVDSYCDFSPLGIRYNRQYVSSVDIQDVQKWLKRGRRRYYYANPKAGKLTYYITSEYGPKSLRPHYHGILYNISLDDFDTFFRPAWGLGNVDSSALVVSDKKNPMAVTNYVSKYCSKGMFENPRVRDGIVRKCFHLVSNGFGSGVLPKLRERILEGLPSDVYTISRNYGITPFSVRRSDEIFELYTKMNDKDNLFDKSELKSDFLPNSYLKVRSSCPLDMKRKCPFYKKWKRNKITLLGDKVVYFPPTKEVIDRIISRLKLSFYDVKSKKTFEYTLPRYYRVHLFGQGTPLSKEIGAYVSLLLSNRLDSLATKRYTANRSKGYTLETAYKTIFRSFVEDAESKEREFNESLARFYSLSKF